MKAPAPPPPPLFVPEPAPPPQTIYLTLKLPHVVNEPVPVLLP